MEGGRVIDNKKRICLFRKKEPELKAGEQQVVNRIQRPACYVCA
eukprot:COSAG02_NODE_1831_length_10724_cov_44.091859_2_plen_44_part_00